MRSVDRRVINLILLETIKNNGNKRSIRLGNMTYALRTMGIFKNNQELKKTIEYQELFFFFNNIILGATVSPVLHTSIPTLLNVFFSNTINRFVIAIQFPFR